MNHIGTMADRRARIAQRGRDGTFNLSKALKRPVTWVRNGFYPDPALDPTQAERIPAEQERRTRFDDGKFTRD